MKSSLSVAIFVVVNFFSVAVSAQTGWQWAIASSSTDSSGYDLVDMLVDKSANIVMTYAGSGTMILGADTLSGGSLMITKMDASRHVLWSLVPGGSAAASAIGSFADSAGYIYLLGYYQTGSTGSGYDSTIILGSDTLSSPGNMYFLTKISPAGAVVWAKNICTDGIWGVRGLGAASASSSGSGYFGIDAQINIYVSGSFNQPSVTIGSTTLMNADTSGVTSDNFLAKYDSAGHVLWAQRFGGDANDGINALAVTTDGYIFINGISNSDSFSMSRSALYPSYIYLGYNYLNFISKFDTEGRLIWAKKINEHLGVMGMTTDKFDNYYMSGFYDSSIVLGPDTLINSPGQAGYFISKSDSGGNELWAKGTSTTMPQPGIGERSIAIDTCGNVWVCSGGDSLLFDGHLLYAPTTATDPFFIAEFNSSGNFLQGMNLPSGGDDWNAIVLDGAGNFYIGGDYYGTGISFGSYSFPYPLGITSPEQLFVAQYRYNTVGCDSVIEPSGNPVTQVAPTQITLFPNPANAAFTISCTGVLYPKASIVICDVTGRLMNTYPLTGYNTTISVADLPPGLYLCGIDTDGQGVTTRKLLVMR